MIGVMKMSETSESRKKNKLRTILIWTVIALMLITGIACFALTYALLGIKRPSVDLSDYDLHANANLPYVDDIVNIAVFGLDSRTHENSGRSDLIMVLTFDSIHGKIKATSIMRDSLVDIKGVGNVKINSAYAYGGAKLAINTINRNFGLNITDYISVNFSQMAEIVDAVGGIEVEISEAERQNANKYIKEMAKEEGFEPDLIEESGAVKLRGYQAVSYSRIRSVGNSDFKRTERQREVMRKIFKKLLDANPVQYPSLLGKLLPLVETSLSNNEIMSIGTKMLIAGKPEFKEARLPDGSYKPKNGGLDYDLDEATKKLHDFIYNDIEFFNQPRQ
jgi:LCP family protein required for cell wall assembly